MDSAQHTRRTFFNQLKSQADIGLIFEFLPDIAFWVKNEKFEFVMGNQTVVEICGFGQEEELIGKTDFDIFPEELAGNFRRDDMRVLQKRKEIIDRVELVPNVFGMVDWCITNKIPLFSKTGGVIGIAGTTRKIKPAGQHVQPGGELSKVIEYIGNYYMRPLNIEQLAKMSNLSPGHFGRKFKQHLGLTPSQYISKIRVKAACKALARSRAMLLAIAKDSGFNDQRYFCKQFKLHMGMHPNTYREKFFKGA